MVEVLNKLEQIENDEQPASFGEKTVLFVAIMSFCFPII
jgi:hypothetical protein